MTLHTFLSLKKTMEIHVEWLKLLSVSDTTIREQDVPTILLNVYNFEDILKILVLSLVRLLS